MPLSASRSRPRCLSATALPGATSVPVEVVASTAAGADAGRRLKTRGDLVREAGKLRGVQGKGPCMTLIKTMLHPDLPSTEGNVLRRQATRGIILRGESILLLFTERYNDFSLPGGGVDSGEELVVALGRELEEETGARDVQVKDYIGFIEEYRPHWKPAYDLMHMTSHYFVCDIAQDLAEVRMENYEVANGMRPLWVSVDEAYAHNRSVMARGEKTMGLSIQRETFMLEKISRELLQKEALVSS